MVVAVNGKDYFSRSVHSPGNVDYTKGYKSPDVTAAVMAAMPKANAALVEQIRPDLGPAPQPDAWLAIGLVGPPGLEPGTKGFAVPARFRAERTISSPSAFAGGVRDARACHQGHCSPQVVSAPSGGVPPAWLRIATVRPSRGRR